MRFVLIFFPVICAALGQLILKTGMNQIGRLSFDLESLVKALTHPLVLLGLVFYFGSALVWFVVLSRENLSFVYPLVAFSYVVTVAMSRLILHEQVPSLRWIGLGVIIVGILLVAKSA